MRLPVAPFLNGKDSHIRRKEHGHKLFCKSSIPVCYCGGSEARERGRKLSSRSPLPLDSSFCLKIHVFVCRECLTLRRICTSVLLARLHNFRRNSRLLFSVWAHRSRSLSLLLYQANFRSCSHSSPSRSNRLLTLPLGSQQIKTLTLASRDKSGKRFQEVARVAYTALRI